MEVNMRKINEKLKIIALTFCVIYTAVGLLTQTVKVAWAFDEWDLKRIVEDAISSKISAYDWDFKNAVESIVEDCDIYGSGIDC